MIHACSDLPQLAMWLGVGKVRHCVCSIMQCMLLTQPDFDVEGEKGHQQQAMPMQRLGARVVHTLQWCRLLISPAHH